MRPLALLLAAQAFRLRVHPAFAVFAGIVVLHGAIATFNLHTTLPAIYGAKLLVNVLFGFIAGRQLMQPSRRILLLFALVWLVSVGGVVLDKFVYTFPWMGLETHVGGIQVDVSRGWDIDSGFDKRAAGFTRSSISAAMLLPTLALVIAPRIRNVLIRLRAACDHDGRGGAHNPERCAGRDRRGQHDPVRAGLEPLLAAMYRPAWHSLF